MDFPLFLFIVLFLDKIFNELPNSLHPICFVGKLAIKAEEILRKGDNGRKMFFRGVLAYFFVLIPSLFISIFTTFLPIYINNSFLLSTFIALFWAWICISPSSLASHAKAVIEPLEREDIVLAQEKLSMIVGRNTKKLDSHSIALACIESISENVTDGVFSTLFWASMAFVLVQLDLFREYSIYITVLIVLLIVLHRVSNVLDAMWGKKDEKYINFGTMAAISDDILNYIPARIGLFVVLFASYFMKKAKAKNALFKALKYRNAHQSPNSAWTESAFAIALDLQFGGKVEYKNLIVDHPIIGEGRRNASALDIYLAIKLMWLSTIIFTFLMTFIIYIFNI